MDEQELSLAIDLLNQEGSPGVRDPELLVLARRVRGLREPAWPEDQTAFVRGLLPQPAARHPRPRNVRLWGRASAAATVLLAAAVGSSALLHAPTVLPIPGFAFAGAGSAISPASGATTNVHSSALKMTFATANAPAHASLNVPGAGVTQTQVKDATSAPESTAQMLPALHLDGVALVQGPPSRVEIQVHLDGAAQLHSTGASLSSLFSHRQTTRVTLQSTHDGSVQEWIVRLPAPANPGWYLLDLGSLPPEIAFFLPYPQGTTITGSTPVAHQIESSTPVAIDSVLYARTQTTISLHFASVPGTWSLRLHVPGAPAEAPLRTAVLPGSNGVKATFNPIVQGSGKVYLEVVLPARTVWLKLPTP